MADQTATLAWKHAKENFEKTASKKKPGDPKKAGILGKWLTKFKSHTGITPLCTAYDKAAVDCGPDVMAKDVKGREKRAQSLESAGDALRTQLKAYLDILKKEIKKELPDDVSPEVLGAYEKMCVDVEMISKMVKVKQLQVRADLQRLAGGNGAELGGLLGNLVSMHKSIEKAIIGMEAMVKNIKSTPTFDNFMKQLGGDPPTRWMTTQYKLLGMLYTKVKGLQDEVKLNPKTLEQALLDYGANYPESFWREKFGNRDERTASLAFAKAIEDEIAHAKTVAIRMKAFSQKFK